MAAIIGRQQEQNVFKRLLASNEAEMIVVYGRRRVGKTYLVNQAIGVDNFSFKATGLYKRPLKEQLINFALALKEYSNSDTMPLLNSWMDAFINLKSLLLAQRNGKKQVVFIDELPWLDTRGSKFLAAFEWFWNSWGNTQDDLLLIVCGSATNWIINTLFKHKGGLYNRATSKLYLKPFTLAETEQYLTSQNIILERYDIAQLYMIMGGIPYYLKQLEPGRTVADNIDNCFFKKNGKLWDEFDNLYETLFSNSVIYLRIVEALASRLKGLTRDELIQSTQLASNGIISKALQDLEKCGFIRTYKQFGCKTKGKTYQLTDFYTLFYYKFIKDNYGQDEHFWTHMLDNPQKNAWQGYTFEQLIKDHIEPLKRALGISSVLTNQSSWNHIGTDETKGAQIDLLIDRRDKAINLCEAKFYSSEFVIDKDYSLALRNKTTVFKQVTKTRKSIIPTMITTYGITENKYSGFIQQQATLDDLFIAP